MDRDWLASRLSDGRSIESIAREAGRSPATVGYWVNKHGLASAHAAKHAARGGIARDELEALVGLGTPIRAMAEQLGVSYTTVRHWLKRYGLTTPRARRLAETAEARAAGADTAQGVCAQHGQVTFVRRGADGFRCQRCRMEAVDRRRRKLKRILVDEAGGACLLCGYAGSLAALHFHHLDPATKSFAVAGAGMTRSLASSRAEAAKCVLLCAR
jgi:transposase-like protein